MANQASNRRMVISPSMRLAAWRQHHRYLLRHTWRELAKQPLATTLTSLVIAIALTLPSLLYVLVQQSTQLTQDWHAGAQISLYLHTDLSTEQGQQLAASLAARPEISSSQYISREQSLAQFRDLSGLHAIIDRLASNPLPAVIVLAPERTQLELLDALLPTLNALPEVDRVELDLEWLVRLSAILQLLVTALWVLAGLLIMAVILVVGNTLRMAIEQKRSEIVVMKLVGATNAFVRRPFLHLGFAYGLMGGLFTLGLVHVSLSLLRAPLGTLLDSYQVSDLALSLSWAESLALLALALLVAQLGTWLAVARNLKAIEPS